MSVNPFIGLKFNMYDYPDQLRTVFGGNNTYIDPYTKGYHYVYFFLPKGLSDSQSKFLTTVCQSVVIPTLNVNPIEYAGTNNLKWYYPGTVEWDSNRFTCKFVEFQGLPILQTMGQWVNIFRNMIYGISDPEKGSTTQGGFKGRAIYATTLFDGKTVQFAAAFTGIYPVKVPTDAFGSDKTNHEKVEHDIDFSFDQMYTGENVISAATALVSATQSEGIKAVTDMYNEATSGSSNI